MSETLPTPKRELPPWHDPKNDLPPRKVHIDLEQHTPDHAILKCPVCGYEYNHLSVIEVRGKIGQLAGVATRIDAAGTSVFHSHVRNGFGVDLEFSGECGHNFTYTLEFNKGRILVYQRERPGCRRPHGTLKTLAYDGVF